MKKRDRRAVLTVLLLAALLLGALPARTARAAEGGTTYTVRFFAGKQGAIDGQEMVEYKGLAYGQELQFDLRRVTVTNDDRYYVKGIRESGKDNNKSVDRLAFKVYGDQDYVVAYGILGSSVAYTVNFQDAEGNALAPSETYHGNIGDKPVVAYLYIEGYQPQAYNLTRTLSENAADNVFTFVYTPVAGPGPQAAEEEEEAAGAGTEEGAGGAEAGAEGGAGAAGAGPGAGGAAGGEAGIPDEGTPLGGPEDIVDLDDEETPLGSLDLGGSPREEGASASSIPTAARVGVGAAAAVVLCGCLLYFLYLRRRKEKNE